MPFRLRTMAREVATAFAVLAVYLLVLLAPLHQAAGLQRDLSTLGYAALDTWSICTPLAQQDESEVPRVAKCAAAGIGKNQLASIEPVVIASGTVRVAVTVEYRALPPPASSVLEQHPGIPRAPPAFV